MLLGRLALLCKGQAEKTDLCSLFNWGDETVLMHTEKESLGDFLVNADTAVPASEAERV